MTNVLRLAGGGPWADYMNSALSDAAGEGARCATETGFQLRITSNYVRGEARLPCAAGKSNNYSACGHEGGAQYLTVEFAWLERPGFRVVSGWVRAEW